MKMIFLVYLTDNTKVNFNTVEKVNSFPSQAS